MMVPMGDEMWLELNAPSAAETAVPPVMHAVPASAMGVLPEGQLVTMGSPGGWWLIDEASVGTGPHTMVGVEVYNIVPHIEWGALTVRPGEQATVRTPYMQVRQIRVATADLWVYRPVDEHLDLVDLAPRPLLDNLQTDILTPPAIRRPRPARELPSLTGRRLYCPWDPDGPSQGWAVAMSEPFAHRGDIVVKLVSPWDWPKAVYSQLRPETVITAPLHRLWAY